jgi:hypothetical protein
LRDNNLIEFSRGSYAWRGRTTFLWPPTVKTNVKIRQDGKVVHFESDDESDEQGFYVGRLDAQTPTH